MAILCVLPSMAQQEFAPIGAKWYVNREFYIGNNRFKVDILESLKDTVVQDKVCRLINDYIIYEEANKIYYLYNDTLRLIYDFSVEIGDTVNFEIFSVYNNNELIDTKFKVDTIENILHEGTSLKRFTLTQIVSSVDDFLFDQYIYYDKFGSLYNLIDYPCIDAILFLDGRNLAWLRCYKDSEIEFHTPYFLNSDIGEEDCDYVAPLVGVESVNTNDITCYPNPFHNQLTIQTNDLPSGHLDVFDVTGKLIYTTVIYTNQFDLSHLDIGLYFIVVRDGAREVYREKMVRVE